jgi:hypothetical protein
MKNILCAVALLLFMARASAQTAQPPVTKTDFKLFFEKAYLHTDREHYAAGEDIWFKAYLVNAQANQLLNSSNNLYVELINPQSAIVDRKLIRLDNGLGKGDFKLSDSAQAGTYRLRAYTNWMLNFGDNFIFEKQLHIYSDIKAAVKPAVINPKKQKVDKVSAPPPPMANTTVKTASLRFFPEGGSMIEGVAGVVAFKAEDANGKGMQIKGGIYTPDGEKVTDIESNTYGLGSFALLPIAGKVYEARGTYPNNKTFDIQLPQALLKGLSLSVRSTDSLMRVIVSTNAATLKDMQNSTLKLQGKSRGQTLFTAGVALKDLQSIVNIPRATLPQGITSLVLVDADGKPQAERLVYNERAEKANISLMTDQPQYGPKGKVTLHIKTTDQNGLPVKANLSLAAVDAGLIPTDDGNIQSYLYLQSEVRGTIENPAQYFDERNPQRKQQLDLLLLTQGWRDFVWKRLADSAIRISYALEQGITVTGRVRGVWFDRPVANMNITLFANGAKGTKLFATQSDAKGKYAFYGLNLWGDQAINLSSTNDKGSQTGLIVADTSSAVSYPVKPMAGMVDSANAFQFKDQLLRRQSIAKKTKLTDTTFLREVNIRSNNLPVKRVAIDTILKMNRADYKLKTLIDYIIEKIPGSNLEYPRQAYFYGLDNNLRYTKMRPVFTADTIPLWKLRTVKFYDIPLDQIIEIHFRKVTIDGFTRPEQAGRGFRRGDNFWIDLKLKPHALDAFDFHVTNVDVEGYYQSRTFYQPKYEYPSTKTDYRTTIHWDPNVTTPLGEATITWYNADPKTRVRIVAEGVTDKGLPISGSTFYEVK